MVELEYRYFDVIETKVMVDWDTNECTQLYGI